MGLNVFTSYIILKMILIKIKVIIHVHNSKCEYFKHVLKYQLTQKQNSELSYQYLSYFQPYIFHNF